MSDLISRSALIKYLQDPLGYCKYCEDCPEIDCMDCIIDGVIKEAPAVDAVEVVHGRWERCWQEKSKHYFRCSNCLTAYMDGVSGAIGPEYGNRAWRYCPNCGAKMDGERKDDE